MTDNVILLAHGSGGKLTHDLVERLFLRYFTSPTLLHLDDSAVLESKARIPAWLHNRQLRRQPAVLPRGRHRQSWRCAARSTT